MRRAHRWWLGALGALCALPLLAIALLLWWLDPDTLRPVIEAQARERLGISLQLAGPLRWTLWPALSVQGGPGALGTAQQPAMLRWRDLRFTLQWPGWHPAAWQLDGLMIDGLQMPLHADAAGQWNVAALADAISAAQTGTVSRPLRIQRLRLRDADIELRTAPESRSWHLAHLAVDAALDGSADQRQWTLTDLRLSGQLGGGLLPEAAQPLSLDTAQVVIGVPSDSSPAAASTAAAEAGQGGTLRIAPLQARLGAASLRITAQQPLQWRPLRAAGELHFESVALRDWLSAQGVALPPTRDARVLRALSLDTRWQLTDVELQLDALRLQLDDTHWQGHIGGRWRAPQDWQLELQADALDLDRYRRPDSDPGEPFRLPVAALRALPLNGSLRLQRLTAGGVVARDARIDLHSAPAATPEQAVRKVQRP